MRPLLLLLSCGTRSGLPTFRSSRSFHPIRVYSYGEDYYREHPKRPNDGSGDGHDDC